MLTSHILTIFKVALFLGLPDGLGKDATDEEPPEVAGLGSTLDELGDAGLPPVPEPASDDEAEEATAALAPSRDIRTLSVTGNKSNDWWC
jgi:hypothetical protein